jgi:hypothetical protein
MSKKERRERKERERERERKGSILPKKLNPDVLQDLIDRELGF